MPIDRSKTWRRTTILAAMWFGIITLLMSPAPAVPLLIYNASGSAPLGLYYLEQRLPARGELAVFKPSAPIELLIAAYEILPDPVPLLKRVEASGGDEVCRAREPIGTISVNGKVIAEVLERDGEGRPLPSWEGCMRLVEGEYFLLQPHPRSFDSRYFGPVLRCDILGVARPLWTWNPDN
ncbi:S26 family signal peptidase [Bradyrhizobium tropiciagri]|uniref:S26 family signal peptidase n=1 Tax=Bradyrhizobium tropiciagri TaxID=312253 RepID=UPI001BA52F64|nr:S26 family signal peptidase [Bradyrhizobium tropiciagri]MBR0900093.1 S26 family signal peptidase [Bradyrhizobium tropiciagri]